MSQLPGVDRSQDGRVGAYEATGGRTGMSNLRGRLKEARSAGLLLVMKPFINRRYRPLPKLSGRCGLPPHLR
jgi:hypothetical protein